MNGPSQRRFQVPREDFSALIEPPAAEVGRMVEDNLRHRGGDYDCQGRSLADLSVQARAELLAAARRWTAAYRDVAEPSAAKGGKIFLAGHQPELFHPGVWFKNFALGTFARRHGAAAVNLVIDSDTMKSTSLPTPGGSVTDPRREAIPMDAAGPEIPYEERPIHDAAIFADFGRRVAEQIAPLVKDPMIREFWPMVVERSAATGRLGYCLAQARHQWEGQWGLDTLEVPQSWVCQCESFRWFAAHLLTHLPRFLAAYNEAVRDYRRAHRIRNAAQPVPDLTVEGDTLESPLWIWTTEDPRRRRLLARRSGRELVLSDQAGLELRLALDAEAGADRAVEQFEEWERRGIKIRSRALVTTLWARLALGDLFLHGIGGAKYDQVTDGLIARFFGLPPPGILVVSATLHLPIPRPRGQIEDPPALARRLREMEFHPERFLRGRGDGGADAGAAAAADSQRTSEGSRWESLLAEKESWIRTAPTPKNARERWVSLRRINAALAEGLAAERRALLALEAQMARVVRAEKLLSWREYGFCLYPKKNLREFLDQLLPKIA
jgi:hypothetical protein